MTAIRGTVAVVTGAASGIGRAIAAELSARGARVARLDVEQVALGEDAGMAVVADVSSRAACERAVTDVHEQLGDIGILVNCAGIGYRRAAHDAPSADVERVMAVNYFGAVYLAEAVLPGMLDRKRGSVVNIGSVAAHLPNPKESAYGASKAALTMWTHGMAVDLRGSGVHAGVLAPGPVATGIWSTLDPPPRYRGRLFSPEIVGRAAARMIERESVHVTVPRAYGTLARAYALGGRPMRWALNRYERG